MGSPQPTFLVELSKVLANPGNSQVARVAAGLQIKNSLTSKDPDIKAQYQQRWLAIDANARREVKNFVSARVFCLLFPSILGQEGWVRDISCGFPPSDSSRARFWELLSSGWVLGWNLDKELPSGVVWVMGQLPMGWL